jgi:NaMN:DMB phosphoribosyltransferase
VVEEGISAYPQAVTGQMLRNFVGGGAAISVLARQLDARLEVVDLGTIDSSRNCLAYATCAWARAQPTSPASRR